jgi:hypothetical protein
MALSQSQYILASFVEVQMEIQTLGLMGKEKLEHGGDFRVIRCIRERKCRSQLLETNTINSLIHNI